MAVNHVFLKNNKRRHNLAGEYRECSCGVWRYYDDYSKESIPCYNSGEREKTSGEALVNLNQKIRNLGYLIYVGLSNLLYKLVGR